MWRLLATLVAVTLTQGALAQQLILDDPLTNSSTSGTRGGSGPGIMGTGGTFIQGEGWKCTGVEDCIYWHLSRPVSRGAAEFCVKGLKPNSGSEWEWPQYPLWDKSELFHMYDYTVGNSDNQYGGGYRDNPYKVYVRKIGPWSRTSPDAKNRKLELVWLIQRDYVEPDSQTLGWNSAETYKFHIEWAPTIYGTTVETITRTRLSDNYTETIQSSPNLWAGGFYTPNGHSVRIGASTRRDIVNGYPVFGAPDGAIYSNVKVWQYAPSAPTLLKPIRGHTFNTLTPTVKWLGEPHTAYQVRINTANDPNSGVAWDSGQVTSTQSQTVTGTLTDQTTYYLFVRLANQAGWGDWTPAGHRFRVDTSYVWPRTGMVTVNGHCLQDNGGMFLGLGATYMRALQRCKYYRDRYEMDLSNLSARGFNYIRILSMVGWDGQEIMPITSRNDVGETISGWSDYDQQLKDAIDIAYDQYRIRTQITIFADAQNCMPNASDRYAHMDRILADIAGREHKVIMIEVANEYWQNGFPDPGGVSTVRTYAAYLAARTSVPVSCSSPSDAGDNSAIQGMYVGSAADIATVHFSRDIGTSEGGWLPVRDCWRVEDLYPGVPPVSSNEPIGAGSSVNTENDPIKLCSAAVFAWIAKLPMYVYHSRAGVSSIDSSGNEVNFITPLPGSSLAGSDVFQHAVQILPNDLPNWARNDGIQPSAPFTVYCNGTPNLYWTSVPGATSGCHRNIGAIKGRQFVCYPQGILSDGVRLQARKGMSVTIYNPLTGEVVGEPRTLGVGDNLDLQQGPGAYIIRGTFTEADTTVPGPVTKFAVNPSDGQNALTWQNPGDADFWGTRIVFRTDRYPGAVTDGTLVCDKVGVAGTRQQFVHTGLANGTHYYYAAFAYDDTPNYSSPATATGTPAGGQCFSETFTYPDGSLVGNRGWTGSAGSEVGVLSDAVKISGGSDNKEAVQYVSCSGSGGVITAHVRVKAGLGSGTLWGFWIDDANGNNLARWYGSGTTARPRIGGTSLVLDSANLTGGWDDLSVRINTSANTSEFFLNGASLGTLNHSSTGAGDSVGRVMLERIYNSATNEFIYLDNVVIGPYALDAASPGPVTGFSAVDQGTQVALSWSNPTDADFAGTKILYKTTGYPDDPSDGTLIYDATGSSCVHADPPGGTVYYAAFAYDWGMNFAPAATASVTRPIEDCYTEPFPYPDGALAGNGGWTGSATTQIAVESQAVKISGGAGACDALHYIDCSGGPLAVRAKIRKGSGTAAIWNLWIDDPSGTNLGRWYGTGTAVRGRVGTGTPTGVATLTGNWDDAYVKIDFGANTTQFVLNGVSLGAIAHSASDQIGSIKLERLDSSGATGQCVYLDDLAVGQADVTAPTANISSPSALVTRTGPVSYSVSFSETVYGFGSASDIQVNSTETASAGSVSVTGSGPFTVTLANISGSGTLGISVKASSCTDIAANANPASLPSETFRVLGSDGRISAVKDDPDGAVVGLGNKALYLRQDGFGYIEETDRSSGIRVEGALTGAVGDLVCLSGQMSTTPGGERCVLVDAMSPWGSETVMPVGLNNRALLDQMACGLLVKAWGKVKPGSVTPNSYVITDGSDDSGIRILTAGAPGVSEGEFVSVTGAAGFDGVRVVYRE